MTGAEVALWVFNGLVAVLCAWISSRESSHGRRLERLEEKHEGLAERVTNLEDWRHR